ncbi:MAG: DUF3786 domain-containing protein [Syntrophobacteraceae bacterium]
MSDTSSQFISVHTLANRFEADVLMDALRQEGIPAFLRGFEETPYTGLFVPQRGWGRVMVPREMESQAREIVDALIEDIQGSGAPYADASEIDPQLWEMLRGADPAEIVKNALVEYDPEEDVYIVPFFNTVVVCWPEAEKMQILGVHSTFSQDFQVCLVVLHYLLGAQDSPLSQKWVSEKDLPSGSLFFQGVHALPVESLANIFDAHPELLETGALRIGAEKTNLGDLSYRFRVLPRIPLLLIFWLGDEEFEATFHILFDDSITVHFGSLDLIFALVNVFSRVLMQSASPLEEGGEEEGCEDE